MTNNPAFPTIYDDTTNFQGAYTFGIKTTEGMTMLEYYAGCALGSLDKDLAKVNNMKSLSDAAKWCFDMAEAMCEEAERRRNA